MAAKPVEGQSTSDDVMAVGEIKLILAVAKRGNPVNCAIALTKDKEGVLLLDKKMNPKNVGSALKKQAESLGLALDMATLCFGKAMVSDDDQTLVRLVVNKHPASALRPRILERVKKAGYGKLEITTDDGLDDEPEEETGSTGDAKANAAAMAKDAAALEKLGKIWEAAETKLREEFESIEQEIAVHYEGDPNAAKTIAFHKTNVARAFKTLDGTLGSKFQKARSCKSADQMNELKNDIRGSIVSSHKFLSSDTAIAYLRKHPLGAVDVDAIFSPILRTAALLVK